MAALDPTAPPQSEDADSTPRATLKILRDYVDPEEEDSDFDSEDDEDDDDVDAIERRIADALSDEDEEEDSEDEDRHGGPSDPARSKKAKKEAALKALLNGMAEDDESEEEADGVNGAKKNKGKAKANGDISDVSMSDMEDESALFEEMDKFVLCTLDTDKVR
jgi:FK506-binding nuclear protein